MSLEQGFDNNAAFSAVIPPAGDINEYVEDGIPNNAKRHSRKLPHDVTDDRRLSLKGYFLIGYRARQSRRWSIRVRDLEAYGLGEDAAYAAMNELKLLDYLKRSQSRKRGEAGWHFSFAQDELDLSAAPKSKRRGYQLLWREIDGLRYPRK